MSLDVTVQWFLSIIYGCKNGNFKSVLPMIQVKFSKEEKKRVGEGGKERQRERESDKQHFILLSKGGEKIKIAF